LEAKKNSMFRYMDNELSDFKEFVKNKVGPVKSKVMKIQNEVESFKNPILQELISIRNQNEALLRELTRQKTIYREMLGEFYKMIAINESHAQNIQTQDLMNTSYSPLDSPSSNKRRNNVKRQWRFSTEDNILNLKSPSISQNKEPDDSLEKLKGEDIEVSRTKSTPKHMSPNIKNILKNKRRESGKNFSLTDNLKKVSPPLSSNLRRNLTTL